MASQRVPVDSFSQTRGQAIGHPLPSYESLLENNHTYGLSNTFHSTQSLSEDHRKPHVNSSAQAINEQLFVEGWPIEPRKLRGTTMLTLFLNFCEVLVTLAPIAFISTLVSTPQETLLILLSTCHIGSQA